jgi:hypothetical protein
LSKISGDKAGLAQVSAFQICSSEACTVQTDAHQASFLQACELDSGIPQIGSRKISIV